MPLGTVLNKDHKLHNLRRHDIIAQLPLCFMIGQPQINFFRSSLQHVCNVSDALTNQGIALLQQKSISLSTTPCLLLNFIFQRRKMSQVTDCMYAPHMQTETDIHFHSLKQMYVVFHKRRDSFCVDLADLCFLWVWTWNMEVHWVDWDESIPDLKLI